MALKVVFSYVVIDRKERRELSSRLLPTERYSLRQEKAVAAFHLPEDERRRRTKGGATVLYHRGGWFLFGRFDDKKTANNTLNKDKIMIIKIHNAYYCITNSNNKIAFGTPTHPWSMLGVKTPFILSLAHLQLQYSYATLAFSALCF